MGVALFLNPQRFRNVYGKMLTDDSLLVLSGIIALLFGAFVVAIHNIWFLGWPLLITLLGWWSVIKGVLLLSSPKVASFFSFFVDRELKFYRTIGLISALVGILFLWLGLV